MSRLSDDCTAFYSVTDIYIFAIGDEILDDELKPLATGTGGRHYFRMQNDLINLKEAFDEIIGKSSLKVMAEG